MAGPGELSNRIAYAVPTYAVRDCKRALCGACKKTLASAAGSAWGKKCSHLLQVHREAWARRPTPCLSCNPGDPPHASAVWPDYFVQNGTNCREINHLRRDQLSVLMSKYPVNFRIFGLRRQFNIASVSICIVWDNLFKNHTYTQIVVGLCKFWDIFIFALVSFLATTSSYNIMYLRNNTRLWCQKTFVVEVGAFLWLKFGSKLFTIPQIIFFVGFKPLKIVI